MESAGIAGVLMVVAGLVVSAVADDAPEPSLRGSPAAMEQQNRVAQDHGLSFYRTVDEIRAAVASGELVTLPGGPDYEIADFVDLPHLVPEARLFVERTAALYRRACGEPLVVTSAVRAIADQPPNAHELSVHPAGMAVDLRVSQRPECREWLEGKMLELEAQGLINGIRERRPPHYHIAVFPEPYAAYVASIRGAELARQVETPEPGAPGSRRAWIIALAAAAGVVIWLARRKGWEG